MFKKISFFILSFILVFLPTFNDVFAKEFVSNLDQNKTIVQQESIVEEEFPTTSKDNNRENLSENMPDINKKIENQKESSIEENDLIEKQESNQSTEIDYQNIQYPNNNLLINQDEDKQSSNEEEQKRPIFENEKSLSEELIEQENSSNNEIVIIGDTKYYFKDNEIVYAEVYKNDRIVKIQQYYPNVSIENVNHRVKYNFYVDQHKHIINAEKFDEQTQEVTNKYEYYANTRFGDHQNNIRYIFDLVHTKYVTRAVEREKGSQRAIAWYEYYGNTTYGAHGKNIRYKFSLNEKGHLIHASEREKSTQRIVSWYEYYPNTVYGKHGKKIKYRYQLNSGGNIVSAIEFEKGLMRTLITYQFKSKTKYGKHWSQVNGVKMNVPIISQLPELPTGCEITSVTMMLQYKGISVDKLKLAKEMPRHAWNPNLGYVGNPYQRRGWTIYPSALENLIKKYAGSAVNLTGSSNKKIEEHLFNKKPIVVWVSPFHGFTVHALVLTG